MKRFGPRIYYQTILHIPHSSRYIPEDCKNLFFLTENELQEELIRMTDSYTDELFDVPNVPEENRVVFPYSRLICDVERFRDDAKESMAARGMGVCYEKTSCLEPLKEVTESHRQEMLSLYDQHHLALTDAVNRALNAGGKVLLIDCHSFSSEQLPYEKNGKEEKQPERPDICIGTDLAFHTPCWIRNFLRKKFRSLGYSVKENYPFQGTLVPMQHYYKDIKVQSVMIEVKRSLYMDEKTGEKSDGFEAVKKDLAMVLSELSRIFSDPANPERILREAMKTILFRNHRNRMDPRTKRTLLCLLYFLATLQASSLFEKNETKLQKRDVKRDRCKRAARNAWGKRQKKGPPHANKCVLILSSLISATACLQSLCM